jgi:hypothetical protein
VDEALDGSARSHDTQRFSATTSPVSGLKDSEGTPPHSADRRRHETYELSEKCPNTPDKKLQTHPKRFVDLPVFYRVFLW